MAIQSKIDAAISRSRANLSGGFHAVAPHAGWYHFLDATDRLGHVATAQALLLGCSEEHKRKGVELIRSRFLSAERGWAYNTNVSDVALVDATAWCAIALHRFGSDADRASLVAPSASMLDSLSSQWGGPWGAHAGEAKPRIYHTCMALRLLHEVRAPSDQTLTRGLDWLVGQMVVGPKGTGWGAHPGDDPTVAHTAHVLLTVFDLVRPPEPEQLQRSVQWLASQLAGQNAIHVADISEPIAVANSRIDFKHAGYALGVKALARCSRPLATSEIKSSCVKLLSYFESSGEVWRHGSMQTVQPMWCLYDGVQALEAARGALSTTPVWQRLIGRNALVWTTLIALAAIPMYIADYKIAVFLVAPVAVSILANLVTPFVSRKAGGP